MGQYSSLSPVLVFGANGQVGASLVDILGNSGVGFTRFEADFSQPDSVIRVLETIQPRCVINAAAYTLVDKAETEEDLATQINAITPGLIAGYCYDNQIPFIHYSTDYVFNGTGDKPWSETDSTGPLNAYGRSKLKGEQLIKEVDGNYLIFRTSWVYDHVGKNFLTTMLRLGKERMHLKVVDDQFGAPTYARDLANATLRAVSSAMDKEIFPSGIYHLCHGGVTTWYEFAQQIFQQAKQVGVPLIIETLDPIKASEYPTPAKRPTNSRLDCSKAQQQLGISLPIWQDGLALCMESVA